MCKMSEKETDLLIGMNDEEKEVDSFDERPLVFNLECETNFLSKVSHRDEQYLLVFPGTRHVPNVDSMKGSFSRVPQIFNTQNGYSDWWKQKLEETRKNDMIQCPKYMSSSTLKLKAPKLASGAFATVANLRRTNTNDAFLPQPSARAPSEAEEQEYTCAIQMACLDAIEQSKTLVLTPVGIGVNGWDPTLAARLTYNAIALTNKVQPNMSSPLFKVIIPIHAPSEKINKNDKKFRDEITKLHQGCSDPDADNVRKSGVRQVQSSSSAPTEALLRVRGETSSNAEAKVREITLWDSLKFITAYAMAGATTGASIGAATGAGLGGLAGVVVTAPLLGVGGVPGAAAGAGAGATAGAVVGGLTGICVGLVVLAWKYLANKNDSENSYVNRVPLVHKYLDQSSSDDAVKNDDSRHSKLRLVVY